MKRYLNIFTLIIIGSTILFSGCEKKINVEGVTIHPPVCVIKVGETKQLTAIVTPTDADNKTVRWNTSTLWMIDSNNGESVATISETGKVKGLALGCASVACITNNSFMEARATVYVGYAAAVDGTYSGSLMKNGESVSTTARTGIFAISEDKAGFGLSFLDGATPNHCEITVDTVSEKMRFEGADSINIQGTMTLVKVSGEVNWDGVGTFDIFVSSDKYSFFGTKIPRTPF